MEEASPAQGRQKEEEKEQAVWLVRLSQGHAIREFYLGEQRSDFRQKVGTSHSLQAWNWPPVIDPPQGRTNRPVAYHGMRLQARRIHP